LLRRLLNKRDAEEEEDETMTAVDQAEEQEDLFLLASQNDMDDCLKAYICQVATKLDANLDEFETNLKSNFSQTLSELDVFSNAVEFDLASVIGHTAGVDQCKRVYARCPRSFEQMSGNMHLAFQQVTAQINQVDVGYASY